MDAGGRRFDDRRGDDRRGDDRRGGDRRGDRGDSHSGAERRGVSAGPGGRGAVRVARAEGRPAGASSVASRPPSAATRREPAPASGAGTDAPRSADSLSARELEKRRRERESQHVGGTAPAPVLRGAWGEGKISDKVKQSTAAQAAKAAAAPRRARPAVRAEAKPEAVPLSSVAPAAAAPTDAGSKQTSTRGRGRPAGSSSTEETKEPERATAPPKPQLSPEELAEQKKRRQLKDAAMSARRALHTAKQALDDVKRRVGGGAKGAWAAGAPGKVSDQRKAELAVEEAQQAVDAAEAKRQAEEDRIAAVKEAKRRAEEEEKARIAAEAEAKRLAAEAALAAKAAAEAEAKRVAEENARLAQEEADRQAAQAAAAAAEAARIAQAEEDARVAAEQQRLAEEEQRRAAQAEQRRREHAARRAEQARRAALPQAGVTFASPGLAGPTMTLQAPVARQPAQATAGVSLGGLDGELNLMAPSTTPTASSPAPATGLLPGPFDSQLDARTGVPPSSGGPTMAPPGHTGLGMPLGSSLGGPKPQAGPGQLAPLAPLAAGPHGHAAPMGPGSGMAGHMQHPRFAGHPGTYDYSGQGYPPMHYGAPPMPHGGHYGMHSGHMMAPPPGAMGGFVPGAHGVGPDGRVAAAPHSGAPGAPATAHGAPAMGGWHASSMDSFGYGYQHGVGHGHEAATSVAPSTSAAETGAPSSAGHAGMPAAGFSGFYPPYGAMPYGAGAPYAYQGAYTAPMHPSYGYGRGVPSHHGLGGETYGTGSTSAAPGAPSTSAPQTSARPEPSSFGSLEYSATYSGNTWQ